MVRIGITLGEHVSSSAGADDGGGLTDPLVWVDLEMTGLDPQRHRIVEIATIVTDGTLETVIEGPDLIVSTDESTLAEMEDTVRKMHAASGLLEEIAASSVTAEQAEDQTLQFVRRWVPDANKAPLAGNTVHADRVFLRWFMPALHAHLHYRNVDVSTLKELMRRWYPATSGALPSKSGSHRALADIRESINELRFYRSAVFR